MKTNAKKRMLISSVAMLLVAMIALGTATFAWFTTSTEATASGINVHTAKASTLQIAGNDTTVSGLGWGSTVNYNFNQLLRPTSTVDYKNWYTATAASQTAYAASEKSGLKLTDTTGYVFVNQLNVRNAGAAAVNDVKITVSGFNGNQYAYARIALVEAVGLGKNVAASTAVGAKNYLAAQDNTAYAAVSGLTTDKNLTTTNKAANVVPADGVLTFDVADSLAAVTKGENDKLVYDSKFFNLYIWFEGQDSDCYSDNPVDISNLTFTVSGTTETQS